MTTTDHNTLRLEGTVSITRITSLTLHVGVNAHGRAVVEGFAGEDAFERLTTAPIDGEQRILFEDETGVERVLFAGILKEADLCTHSGCDMFRVELFSGTRIMDHTIRSRSFQNVAMTYSRLAQQIAEEYDDGAVICTVGEERPIERPVIQYRETDWAFLKRLAGHCGGVIVPETHSWWPRIWFGFPERSFTCSFPEHTYTFGTDNRYYELGGPVAGYDKADFFYYDVKSRQHCDLGWYTIFKDEPFLITDKYAELDRGELIFTYRLGRQGLGWGKRIYNEKINGMTILGDVVGTERDTVKLKLDIDKGHDPGGAYPYPWRPETGNLMYCMPKVGTRVSLYFPGFDEKDAFVVNCIRTNGASCERMSDPSKRSFTTEHGKELNLYPDEMSLVGGSGNALRMVDGAGLSITTSKRLSITGASVSLSAPKINLSAPMEMKLLNSAGSGITLCRDIHMKPAARTLLEGTVHETFPAIQDAPNGRFQWGKLAGNVLAGLAIACSLASMLILPLFSVAIRILISGLGAITNQVRMDIASGTVSDAGTYINKGLTGAISMKESLKPFSVAWMEGSVTRVSDKTIFGNQFTLEGFGQILAANLKYDGSLNDDFKFEKKEELDPYTGEIHTENKIKLNLGIGGSGKLNACIAQGNIVGNCGLFRASGKASVGSIAVTGKASGSVTIKDNKLSLLVDSGIKGEAKGLSAETEGKFGTERHDVHGGAALTIGDASAEAGFQAWITDPRDSDNNKFWGMSTKVGAEAFVVSGQVSGGFKIMGIKIDVSAKGKALGAGVKNEWSTTTTEISRKFGAGLGLGYEIGYSINWEDFIEDNFMETIFIE